MDRTALRVHGAQDVIDSAILAARVHGLQADQQRALALGVKAVLQLAQLLTVLFDLRLGCRVGIVLALVVGIDLVKPDFRAGLHLELSVIVHYAVLCFRLACADAGAG
jgi:hypothetical protein